MRYLIFLGRQSKKKVDYCFGWQVECAGGGVRAADEELALRPDMDEYVCDVCRI